MLYHRAPSILLTLLVLGGVGYLAHATMAPSDARTFPYSGRLQQGGVDANGLHDFRFGLFTSASPDTTCLLNDPPNCSLWSSQLDDVTVSAGTFGVELAGVPDTALAQSSLFLAMAVKEDSEASFVVLAGTQEIRPAPWAARAAAAADFKVTGTLTGGLTVAGGLDVTGASELQDVVVNGTAEVTGLLGIGIAAPERELHVEGGDLRVRSPDNDATADIAQFFSANLTQGVGIGYDRIQAVGSNASQGLTLVPKGGAPVTVSGSLVVTNGLPITVSNETTLYQANGGDPLSATLQSASRSVCFLTRMQIHDTMGNQSMADCHVSSNGATWFLTVNTDVGSGDPDVECRARCISW